jgi:hypothetical protein
MNELDTGTPATDQAASEPAAATGKAVMITDNGDGSFSVQEMADGQPVGDPVPADSVEAAMQSATDTLGGGAAAEPANPELAGDTGAEPNPDAAGDTATATEEPPLDEKARYAQKRGTRPKVAPNWDDYTAGGNPAAK